MSHFDQVEARFADLKYMRSDQAKWIRDFILGKDVHDILEIGFYHGKSTAYMAAALEDANRGQVVTIDLESARQREPNITQVMDELGLSDRVRPIFAHRSYTWELGKLVREAPRPQFDLCYFDGGHTWDPTGFGFVLVDMLMKPGGWVIFDDINWSIDASAGERDGPIPRHWRGCDAEERATPAVKLVFDTLVPHLGYTDRKIVREHGWGVARKPLGPGNRKAKDGLFSRLFGR